MGREWYQWGAKSSKTRVRGGRRTSAGAKPEPPPPKEVVDAAAAATGCMGVVSHLFDFHHSQFFLHHPDHHHQDNFFSLRGLEAPRNSLETEAVDTTCSLASASDSLHIPMGIQINTGRRDTRLLRPQSPSPKLENSKSFSFSDPQNLNTPINTTSRRDTKLLRVRAPKPETGEEQRKSLISTESSISPAGPRTPTLVARLMGLDLLPEGYPSSSSCTPRSSGATPHRPQPHSVTPKGSRKHSPYDFSGSLMESPRLSLQINKENCGAKEGVVELSRHSCSEINTKRRELSWKGMEEESMVSRSPGYYARQIMKQVKESVMRRKFGADITNKTGEDVQSLSTKGKRPQVPNPEEEAAPLEIAKPEKRREKAQQVKPDWRMSAKRSMSKKEEQFVRADAVATTRASQGSEKKCKTTPLSSELVHGNVVPSLTPLKKSDPSTAPPCNRKPFQEQVSLGTPNRKAAPRPPTPPPPEPAKSGAASAARSELNYISQILKRTGINRDTPVSSFTRWFSPSHPLDPSLFHFLEAESHPNAAGSDELSPRCNRRLMFDLVGEILDHIIRPRKAGRDQTQSGPREWARLHGFQVMRMVWTRVKGFPRADCRILQDIDELVEMDLSGQGSGSGMVAGFAAGEEEEDDIVAEIERELVEALVADTAVAVAGGDNGYFLSRRPYRL